MIADRKSLSQCYPSKTLLLLLTAAPLLAWGQAQTFRPIALPEGKPTPDPIPQYVSNVGVPTNDLPEGKPAPDPIPKYIDPVDLWWREEAKHWRIGVIASQGPDRQRPET